MQGVAFCQSDVGKTWNTDSPALLQDLESCLAGAKTETEASQRALQAAEETLQEQAASKERLEAAVESKNGEMAGLEGQHTQLAAHTQALRAETCRCNPP